MLSKKMRSAEPEMFIAGFRYQYKKLLPVNILHFKQKILMKQIVNNTPLPYRFKRLALMEHTYQSS